MKLKSSLVLLLSVNLVFSSIQLPVFANETNELETQESVSVNSDLEEVDIVEDLAEDVDVISDEEAAEEEMTEENVMETEASAQENIKNKIISYVIQFFNIICYFPI